MIDDDDGRKFDNVIIKLFCVQETFTIKKKYWHLGNPGRVRT